MWEANTYEDLSSMEDVHNQDTMHKADYDYSGSNWPASLWCKDVKVQKVEVQSIAMRRWSMATPEWIQKFVPLFFGF